MNTEFRNTVVEEITRRLKSAELAQFSEDTELAVLGIGSMDIITILMNLEKRVGLDFDWLVGMSPPKTVNDLMTIVASACG